MNIALWKKCLSESMLLFIAIAIGIASFAWFRVHVVGEIDTSTFQNILEMIPQDWLKFTSVDVEWLISYVGRTGLALDEPFMVMMVAMWSIVRGSDVVSGEISRGTMEMMLAQPVSRKQTFVIHTAVTLLGVVVLVLIAWVAMWAAVHMTNVKIPAESPSVWDSLLLPLSPLLPAGEVEYKYEPMSDYVNAIVYWPGMVNLCLLGCFIAGLAAMCSAVDRFRWRTLGIVVTIYMVASMIKILGMSSETFQWSGWLTFFSLYEPEMSIKMCQTDPSAFWNLSVRDESGDWQGFGQLAQNLWLLVGTIAFFVAAYQVFKRRDIPAPL